MSKIEKIERSEIKDISSIELDYNALLLANKLNEIIDHLNYNYTEITNRYSETKYFIV